MGATQYDDYKLIDLKGYRRESYEQFLKRYDGFGNELYTLIQQRLPDVFKNLKFYRIKGNEPKEDEPEKYSIAVYKKGKIILLSNWTTILQCACGVRMAPWKYRTRTRIIMKTL